MRILQLFNHHAKGRYQFHSNAISLQQPHDITSGLLIGPATIYVDLALWVNLKYSDLFIVLTTIHNAFWVFILPDRNFPNFLMALLPPVNINEPKNPFNSTDPSNINLSYLTQLWFSHQTKQAALGICTSKTSHSDSSTTRAKKDLTNQQVILKGLFRNQVIPNQTQVWWGPLWLARNNSTWLSWQSLSHTLEFSGILPHHTTCRQNTFGIIWRCWPQTGGASFPQL